MDFDHKSHFRQIYNLADLAEQEVFGIFSPEAVLNANPQAPYFYLAPLSLKSDFSHSDDFINGRIYIQDYASYECARIFAYLASQLALQNPNLQLLDMCAAPGGKSNALYHLMRFYLANLAVSPEASFSFELAANEANRKRFFNLSKQLKLLNIPAKCFNHDGRAISRYCANKFDAILLDAPCSANSHDFECFKSTKELKQIAKLQKQLLHSALLSTKPGGVIVYATCSFNVCENEEVLQNALDSKIPCSLIPISTKLEHINGLSEFDNTHFDAQISNSVRIKASKLHRGFFIAALKKH